MTNEKKQNAHHSRLDRQLGIIPQNGFMRLEQVLSVMPIGKTAWYDGIKTGKFPKQVMLGRRTSAWRASDIRELVESLGVQA